MSQGTCMSQTSSSPPLASQVKCEKAWGGWGTCTPTRRCAPPPPPPPDGTDRDVLIVTDAMRVCRRRRLVAFFRLL